MEIPLMKNWEKRVAKQGKIYPLGPAEQKLLDECVSVVGTTVFFHQQRTKPAHQNCVSIITYREGLCFVELNTYTPKLIVFTDVLFANNHDLSCQISFIIALAAALLN